METPLTPLDFLRRARKLHAGREAVVDGDSHYTYAEFGARCDRWCRPCRKTFTILPIWSPPHGHYSLYCRKQAAERMQQQHGTGQQAAPHVKDPHRLPDPSTLYRWAFVKCTAHR